MVFGLRPRVGRLERQRNRLAAARVVHRDEIAQDIDGRFRRAEQPLLGWAGPFGPPDAHRRPLPARILSGQRHQPNPRLQQVSAVELRVRDRDQPVAVHPRDGARDAPCRVAPTIDVDVVRPAVPACGAVWRPTASASACTRSPAPCASRACPAAMSRDATPPARASSGVMPRSMSSSIRSPTFHSCRASISTGIASSTASTSHGSV